MPLFDPNRLDVRELAYSVHSAQLTAMTGPFYAAERHARIRHHHLVDEHHPRIDLIGEPLALGGVIRPCARAQPEAAVVGNTDRFRRIFHAKYARHRTEQLFAISRRFFRYVAEHRRRIEASGTIERLSARQYPRARFDRRVDIALQ